MAEYIVYSSDIKPSKNKGELPDVIYNYISNESLIGWHYTLTKQRENAYLFDETEYAKAQEIAELWNMRLKQLF